MKFELKTTEKPVCPAYDLTFAQVLASPGVYERSDGNLFIIGMRSNIDERTVKMFVNKEGHMYELISTTNPCNMSSKYRKYPHKVTLTFEN